MKAVCRSGWTDWFVEGERSAVFVDGNVMVLSELATAVLTRVDGATTLEDIADHLGELFGVPDGGDLVGATRAAVLELVERGVLDVA